MFTVAWNGDESVILTQQFNQTELSFHLISFTQPDF